MLAVLACFAQSYGQDKVPLQIIGAEEAVMKRTDSSVVRILRGNVRVKQEDVYMACDSAIMFQKFNRVEAFGNVHIRQGDSIDAYSKYLRYEGNKKLAYLRGDVRLKDDQMTITTPSLVYDIDQKKGTYTEGAIIQNEETKLESKIGYYYARSKNAFFRDSVILTHPEYVLTADTLKYATETKVAYFFGPTTIVSEEDEIFCHRGWYDTKNEKAFFWQDVKLDNPPRTIWADSLYYERNNGIGKAYQNVVFRDTAQEIVLYGHRANYDEKQRILKAFDHSVVVNVLDGDSLYITADTLYSIEDTLENRTLIAFPNVRFFRDDLSGICDSLVYRSQDSVLNLHYDPVMWSSANQFTGDTMRILLKNNKINQVQLRNNAFLASQDDSLVYNQIKGRNITGYFREDTLRTMKVHGNGESAYFARDEDSAYIGLNKTVCSNMLMRFRNNEVYEVVYYGSPEADFFPIQDLTPSATLLEGFEDRWTEKPKLLEMLDPDHTRLPSSYFASPDTANSD